MKVKLSAVPSLRLFPIHCHSSTPVYYGKCCFKISLLGVSRNLLYSLPGGTTAQFSNLRFSKEAVLHCDNTSKPGDQSREAQDLCHNKRNQCLSVIQRAVQSAERLVCFGLDLFENYPNQK